MEETVIKLNVPHWTIEEETGYKPFTTFWQDFSIADQYGAKAIRDTYKRAFDEWKGKYKYLTELVLVLNHKIWQHYKPAPTLAEVYDELWREADFYACENLKGEELSYYYQTTD